MTTSPNDVVHLVDYRLAAAFFGLPTGTLRRWIHEGRIGRHGSPRRIIVDMREVQTVRDTLRPLPMSQGA